MEIFIKIHRGEGNLMQRYKEDYAQKGGLCVRKGFFIMLYSEQM